MSYIHLRQAIRTEDGDVFINGCLLYRFFGTLDLPEDFPLANLDSGLYVGEYSKVHSKGLLLW